MSRIVTGVVGVTLGLFAALLLDGVWFFALCAVAVLLAVHEFLRIARHWAPAAPSAVLLLLVPLFGYALAWPPAVAPGREFVVVLAGGFCLVLAVSLAVLFARTPVSQSLVSAGLLAFATLYFAVPLASLVHLQRLDTWVLVLALAIIWTNDVAALYTGRSLGRHKLAPVVSPNKTWEGAAGGLAGALVVAAVWSELRLGSVDAGLLVVGGLSAIAGQIGDLAESLFKRGAGIKDSGTILPGHGGMYDRIDALLFGAPVMLLGLLLIGYAPPS